MNGVLLSTVTKMANTSSLVPYEKAPRKIRPENLTEIIPPLDYSFMGIENIAEVESEEPRITSPRKVPPLQKKAEDVSNEKSLSQCLKLNNNDMKDVTNIITIASLKFKNPDAIGWIDLSINALAYIDPVLAQFEHLQILYLHGNNITELKEVNKLAGIKKLWKLTLHSNPIEEIKGYRSDCLSRLPNIRNFDFSCVIKSDRVKANTWKEFIAPNRPKRTIKDD